MRNLGPTVDLFGSMPYPALQSMLDAGAPFGLRNYFRTGFLEGLDDAVIDVLIEHGAALPSPMSQIHLHQMGGAVARGESAFSNRGAAYTYNLISTWVEPGEDDVHVSANRAVATALEPLSAGRAYVNFLASTDIQVWWHQVTGYVPLTNAAYKAAKSTGYYDKNPTREIAVLQLTRGTPTANSVGFRFGNFTQIMFAQGQEFEALIAGKKNAQQAMDDAVRRGNEILRQYEKLNAGKY